MAQATLGDPGDQSALENTSVWGRALGLFVYYYLHYLLLSILLNVCEGV